MNKETDYKFYVPDYVKEEPIQGIDPILLENYYQVGSDVSVTGANE